MLLYPENGLDRHEDTDLAEVHPLRFSRTFGQNKSPHPSKNENGRALRPGRRVA
jgi:hypothetical protein